MTEQDEVDMHLALSQIRSEMGPVTVDDVKLTLNAAAHIAPRVVAASVDHAAKMVTLTVEQPQPLYTLSMTLKPEA